VGPISQLFVERDFWSINTTECSLLEAESRVVVELRHRFEARWKSFADFTSKFAAF
jgi:hypothetical protein